MSRYADSMRLFLGRRFWVKPVVFFGMIAVLITAAALVQCFMPADNDFASGFTAGIMSMCGSMAPMIGVVDLFVLYNAVHSESPGYKYFVSVPDMGVHFKRAAVISNVMVMVQGVVLLTLFYLICRWEWLLVIGFADLLLMTGFANIICILRKQVNRLALVMAALVLTGFLDGFFSSVHQDEPGLYATFTAEHPWVVPVVLAVSVAVYAAGLVVTLTWSRRKWGSRQ